MLTALTLIVIGMLILATWCGVLSFISSVSIVLCFVGVFITASRHDFLGRFGEAWSWRLA